MYRLAAREAEAARRRRASQRAKETQGSKKAHTLNLLQTKTVRGPLYVRIAYARLPIW